MEAALVLETNGETRGGSSPLTCTMLHRKFPDIVKSALLCSEGWVVGGAIDAMLMDETVRDYDIVVPSRELYQVTVLNLKACGDAKCELNSYGGLKFTFKDVTIDIWCEELGHFLMSTNRLSSIYNYKRQILLMLE